MSSAPPTSAAARVRAALPALALLAVLAATIAVPIAVLDDRLQLSDPVSSAAGDLRAHIRDLPVEAWVLVAFDPDFGTYPEIRAAVRAAIDDLLDRGARLALVSLSIEGRALAAAELDRLARAGVGDDRLADLGFVAGAEAGLVRAVAQPIPAAAAGAFAAELRAEASGMAAFDAALIVGGAEMGPRSWVEQVAPRVPELSLLAIAPSFLRPELAPYLDSGQLRALVATVREAAALARGVREGPTPPHNSAPSDRPPDATAMLVGMLIALAVLVESIIARGWRGLRGGAA